MERPRRSEKLTFWNTYYIEDIPIRDVEYINWFKKNKKVEKLSRSYFASILNNSSNTCTGFNIDWKYIVSSLPPKPKNKNYVIDHIVPLSYFNFIHEDGSINTTELKKAWSPANLKYMRADKNLKKNRSVNLVSWPLRFEKIFNREESKKIYLLFKKLRVEDKIKYEEFIKRIIW